MCLWSGLLLLVVHLHKNDKFVNFIFDPCVSFLITKEDVQILLRYMGQVKLVEIRWGVIAVLCWSYTYWRSHSNPSRKSILHSGMPSLSVTSSTFWGKLQPHYECALMLSLYLFFGELLFQQLSESSPCRSRWRILALAI